MIETFDRSLWSALTPPEPEPPALAGEASADVAIVGAGFLGLSTALHLAERGARVMVIERDVPGFGASGRNTGFVVPSLKAAIGPEMVVAALGAARAERLIDLVDHSGEVVFELCRRHGIDCAAETTGWIQPAHSAERLPKLELRARQGAARGRPVRMLDAAETLAATGVPGYRGALLDASGGQLNPLAYVRGLARAATTAGVVLHARSPVTGITRTAAGWRVATARGSVVAGRVVLTTNALVDRLRPDLAATLVPVRVHQIATEVRDPPDAGLLPGRLCLADTRRHTFAIRWSPDGRLVTGGVVPIGPASLARATGQFTRRLARFLPGRGPFRAAHVWTGVIAHTPDQLPRLHELEPGLLAAIGCNGRGVALTTALGRALAGLMTGATAPADFPLPYSPLERIPWRALAAVGPSLWLPWSTLRDHIESR